ncbi:MAG: hypothetical protein J7L77_05090 [Clostridiales bacterium]|nr:hypothetical protein [Clostridiales bacterium]
MLKVKSQKFMFFDDWPLEYSKGFIRKQGKPVRYAGNPVLKPELPHEGDRVSLYGTILHDEEMSIYKMWYPAFSVEPETVANLCYAESTDGYNWVKPELDVVPGTNIVLGEEYQVRGQSIIYDIDEPNPKRRYKFLNRPGHTPLIFSYVSPDGIHWKILDKAAINADSDSHVGLIRHPETGLYMATMRKIKGDRRVWLSTSEDFENWTDPVLVKELPIEASMQTQIYGMQLTYYGAYIMGVVSYYNTDVNDLRGWGKMQGTMDIGLAYSRGGYCWHENYPTKRLINFSGEGNWDGQMIIPASHIILNDDEMRFYYAGCDHKHEPPYGHQKLCIGVATLRPDGFVYIEAGDETAELFTRNFWLSDTGFEINADASGGEILVELCDGEGKPILGFEKENCIPITKDGLRIPIEWKNNPDQSILLNRAVRIKVWATNAKLYSITMINGETDPKYWKFREIDYADILWQRHAHSE